MNTPEPTHFDSEQKLSEQIQNRIDYWSKEADLSFHQVVGVLEFLKAEAIRRAYKGAKIE